MQTIERTIDSLEVADMVGKQHDNVLKDIRRIILHLGDVKSYATYFIESTYCNAQNKVLPCYLLTRKGCHLYATRMTGAKGTQFARDYVNRFNEMEAALTQQMLPDDPLTLALQSALQTRKDLQVIEQDVHYLKNTMRIDGNQEYLIKSKANQQVIAALGGAQTMAYQQLKARAFAQFWRSFKRYFAIPRYGELPKSRFEEALQYIATWRPETALQMEINVCLKAD